MIDPKIVIRRPRELSQEFIQKLVEFICSFGEVERTFVERGVSSAEWVGYALNENEEIISVGVIKNPRDTYVENTYDKASVEMANNVKYYEYGYAGTAAEYRRQGLSSDILRQLLDTMNKPMTPPYRLFATVREKNEAEQSLLKNHSFKQVGKDYLNASKDYNLKLYEYKTTTRSPIRKTKKAKKAKKAKGKKKTSHLQK